MHTHVWTDTDDRQGYLDILKGEGTCIEEPLSLWVIEISFTVQLKKYCCSQISISYRV